MWVWFFGLWRIGHTNTTVSFSRDLKLVVKAQRRNTILDGPWGKGSGRRAQVGEGWVKGCWPLAEVKVNWEQGYRAQQVTTHRPSNPNNPINQLPAQTSIIYRLVHILHNDSNQFFFCEPLYLLNRKCRN